MSKQLESLFDFWVKHNMNVILEGDHGFAKTAMVGQTFERNGLRWKYFSASTMDPWVDLVGIPKEAIDENGNPYIKLIRPKEFQNDEYDAIFLDEFNRAPKKVRNAVMELIQFKSINGHKLNNLRVVWAAINPHDEDETYDVEKLDPAQIDRFHVLYKVPNVPSREFFTEKYGKDVANAAIEWWYGIPEKFRKHVSARRLDYVIECYLNGGDIKYMVDKSTNPSRLVMLLSSGSILEKLKEIINSKDEKALRKFLKNDNNFEIAVDWMKKDSDVIAALVPFVDEERVMRICHDVPGVKEFITAEANIDNHIDTLRAMVNSGTLPKDEEARLRTLMGRGVSTMETKKIIFKPRPELAIHTADETFSTIKDWVLTLKDASPERLYQAYTYTCENLTTLPDDRTALAVLHLMYRCIESNSYDTLVSKYHKIIPIINYVIDYLDNLGIDINSQRVMNVMKLPIFKLSNATKVQGFLDTHHTSLIKKPRVI